jgi:hypothetical protein
MIRINPDPHKGGYAYIPSRAVTAFFPAGHDIKGALLDLNKAGFADERIEVFTGPQGEAQLDVEGKRHGLWVRFMRALEDTFADEAETFERAEWYLRHGGRVVAAFTHGDKELKQRAVEILAAHGGKDVEYWGRWVREFFPERDPAVPAKGLGGLKAALELELRREEQAAANYRRLADQAGELGLAELKAKLEGMASDEAGHAGELNRLLAGT